MKKALHLSKKTEGFLYLVSFFFLGCFLGFFWELIIYRISHEVDFLTLLLNLRGFLHGPWVPIYGTGGVLVLLIGRQFSGKPIRFFLCCVCVCGTVEYFASWLLEICFHARWWDYSDRFLNLNGRICLTGLLVFGFAGTLVVSFLEPAFRRFFLFLPVRFRTGLCVLLILLFLVDAAVSLISPNQGIGVSVLSAAKGV